MSREQEPGVVTDEDGREYQVIYLDEESEQHEASGEALSPALRAFIELLMRQGRLE